MPTGQPDGADTASKLDLIRAGKSLFTWSRRGWLVVGPTAAVAAGAVVKVVENAGRTCTVRIVRVVGTFTRDGVDYATATFTKLPQA